MVGLNQHIVVDGEVTEEFEKKVFPRPTRKTIPGPVHHAVYDECTGDTTFE